MKFKAGMVSVTVLLLSLIHIQELGKSAGALLLDKEEEYFLVHVNFEISNEKEEKAVDDYILVGKVNDNWKICNMPAVLRCV